jgi:hypothetical protein
MQATAMSGDFASVRLQLVTRYRFSVQTTDCRQYSIELLSITPLHTLRQILTRHERRHLLGERGRDKLIDGDVFLLGGLARLLVEPVRKTKTDAAHS